MKKNFILVFLLVLFGIAVLAYDAGKQSNRLSTEQMNFNTQSVEKQNPLTAKLWDSLIRKIDDRAKNHEKRLSVLAMSKEYPPLNEQEVDFSSFLSTQNNNRLTADTRNNLMQKLTMVITNHEMRLRSIKPAESTTTTIIQTGKCKIKQKINHKCVPSNPEDLKTRVNIGPHNSALVQLNREVFNAQGGPVLYYGYKNDDPNNYGGEIPRRYDHNGNAVYRVVDTTLHFAPKPRPISEYDTVDRYIHLNNPENEKKIRGPFSYDRFQFSSSDYRVYRKTDFNQTWYENGTILCYSHCDDESCSCSDRVRHAQCQDSYINPERRETKKKACEAITNANTCNQNYDCKWREIK